MQKTVLNRIIEDKQAWVAARKYTQPLDSFQSMTRQSDRDFYGDLAEAQANGTAYILECKKASPSKGVLRPDFNPKAIATVYKDYATAISVLTDEHYFQGSFEFIPVVRAVASQPILCKDFIIDPYQIYLARHYHADAILLMLSVLCDQEYRELAAVAVTLNMGILTEVSNEAEMHRAVKLGAKVIGINNRNFRDMSIDLNHTRSLAKFAPEGTIIISESGINHHEDIRDLRQYAHGFLIGSSLMSVTNLDFAVRRLLLGENKVCGLTRPIDASIAYESGAVYGGLIFVIDSKRGVTLATASKIMQAAPLRYVGVFRDAPLNEVLMNATTLGLAAVQLHGSESDVYIAALRDTLPSHIDIWQAIGIDQEATAAPELPNNPNVARYVLDTKHGKTNRSGGTGQTFNWAILDRVDLKNIMIAGGLSPNNAAQAAALGACGLDFNSGVESEAGIKDTVLLQAAFAAIRV